MADAWPALCTLIGLLVLLAVIIRWQISAFVALITISIGIGLAAGMAPGAVVETVSKGIGDIMKEVSVILALGAMLGRILEASGGAQIIAQKLVDAFGQKRSSVALLFLAAKKSVTPQWFRLLRDYAANGHACLRWRMCIP